MALAVTGAVHSHLNLRVTFSAGVNDDAELNNPDNYNIVVADPTTAFDFGVVSVTPEQDVVSPTYVDLEMTDCTNGKNYQLVVTPGKITDGVDTIDAPNNTANFVGVSDAPVVLSVIPLSLVQVKVIFSKYMAQLSDLYNPQLYVWNGGIRTLKVDPDTNSSVILTVTRMTSSQIYDLTVG